MKLIPHIDQIFNFRGPPVNLCRIENVQIYSLTDVLGIKPVLSTKCDSIADRKPHNPFEVNFCCTGSIRVAD